MLKIRLTRTGKKNDPRYRMVVAEHTAPIKGKFVSIVGHYDPIHKEVHLKNDEIISWLNKGAKPSNTVSKILTKEKIKHPSILFVQSHKKPKKKQQESDKQASNKDEKPQEISDTKKPTEKIDNKIEKSDAKQDKQEKNNPQV